MGLRIYQATQHCIAVNNGVAWPAATLRTPSLMVTAPGNVAGTIYLAFHATAPANWQVARREQTLIPLTKGQSITFTGLRRGPHAPEELVFGPGYSYLLCDATATTRRMVMTYYRWE